MLVASAQGSIKSGEKAPLALNDFESCLTATPAVVHDAGQYKPGEW